MRVGEPFRIAIVGSRDYPRMDLVVGYVQILPPDTVIISGGARGVDRIAADTARAHGLEVIEHLAEWDRYGKKAGYLRNTTIVEDARGVVAYWDEESRGTLDTIRKAARAGKLANVIGRHGQIISLGGPQCPWAQELERERESKR